jgi:hypothetical protein
VGLWKVSELEIRKHPPSTLRNVDDGPPGGAGAGYPGASTINAKNVNGGVPRDVKARDPGASTINAKKH